MQLAKIPARLLPGRAAGSTQQAAMFAFGGVIFTLDACTVADGLASTLYILALVWYAEGRQRRAVAGGTVLCLALTLATYPFSHGLVADYDPLFRRFISCVAIIATTPVILHSLRARNLLLRLDAFLELTEHPIIATDAKDAITYWNGAAARLYGWSAREAMGRAFPALLSTAYPESEAAYPSGAGAAFWQGQLLNRARNGATLQVLSRRFRQYAGGKPNGMLAIETDITGLNQVAQRLRLSAARYQSIFNTVSIGLWEEDYSEVMARISALRDAGIKDFEAYCREMPAFVAECARQVRLVDVNDSALEMFEAERKSDLLVSLPSLYPPGQTGSFDKIIVALANGAAACSGTSAVRTLRGRERVVQMSINFPAAPDPMRSVLVSVVDDTERQKIQRSLQEARNSLMRANQQSSLGDMTAAIAHQVNHPLAAIIANAEACLRWLDRPEPDFQEARAAIASVVQNSIGAAQVAAHIRALGVHSVPERAAVSVAAVIEETCRVLEQECQSRDIVVIRQIQRSLPVVLADWIQIEQVLLNLLTNAMEALADRPAPRQIIIRASLADATMHVQVQDNGAGIGQADPDQLFNAFHTTKASGMGLGLPICRAVIAAHRGSIWAASAQDGGAIFEFTLPVGKAGG